MEYRIVNNVLTLTIDKETNLETLAEKLCFSRKTRYLLISNRQILLNGQTVNNMNTTLHKDDVLSILLEEYEPDYTPSDKPCKVIYEDELVYVVSKPAGLIVHDETDSLANQAARYLLDNNIKAPVRYIHRLDKETSGLILFSKIPLLQAYFDQQLAERKITRKYLAIAKGNLPVGKKMTCSDPIGADRHKNNVYRVSKTGQKAITEVTVSNSFDDLLLLECRLLTGRTHQIRVHLSHHGLPIINDDIYGVSDKRLKNMGLWAYKLTFSNPFTDKKTTIRDRINPDFKPFTKKDSCN